MGMFDTLCDKHGEGWQTKAFDCNLDLYRIGETIPADCTATYQVEVLGEPVNGEFVDAYATVRDCVLTEVGVDRDLSLPLLDYGGHMTPAQPRPLAREAGRAAGHEED